MQGVSGDGAAWGWRLSACPRASVRTVKLTSLAEHKAEFVALSKGQPHVLKLPEHGLRQGRGRQLGAMQRWCVGAQLARMLRSGRAAKALPCSSAPSSRLCSLIHQTQRAFVVGLLKIVQVAKPGRVARTGWAGRRSSAARPRLQLYLVGDLLPAHCCLQTRRIRARLCWHGWTRAVSKAGGEWRRRQAAAGALGEALAV